MLINLKMPTIVGILTLMSRINFVLSGVEHEKSFITSGPDLDLNGLTLDPGGIIDRIFCPNIWD